MSMKVLFELIKSVIQHILLIRLKHFAKQENDRIKYNKVKSKTYNFSIFLKHFFLWVLS